MESLYETISQPVASHSAVQLHRVRHTTASWITLRCNFRKRDIIRRVRSCVTIRPLPSHPHQRIQWSKSRTKWDHYVLHSLPAMTQRPARTSRCQWHRRPWVCRYIIKSMWKPCLLVDKKELVPMPGGRCLLSGTASIRLSSPRFRFRILLRQLRALLMLSRGAWLWLHQPKAKKQR